MTTIQPAIIAKVAPPSHVGRDRVPPIIPKPTDKATIIAVSQEIKAKTFPFAIFLPPFIDLKKKRLFKYLTFINDICKNQIFKEKNSRTA